MINANKNKFQKIDWLVLAIYIALVTIGWIMIYAAAYGDEGGKVNLATASGKQLLWICISAFSLFFVLTFDVRFWRRFSYGIYSIGILLLILVLIFGSVINGQKAWFNLGFLSFQPAEIAKLGTCLSVANLLSDYKIKLSNRQSSLIVISLVCLPPLLIMFQPDAGSALVFLSFFILLYREGLNGFLYIIGIGIIILFISSLLFGFEPTLLVLLITGILFQVSQFQNKIYYIVAAIILGLGGLKGIQSGNGFEILSISAIVFLIIAFFHYRFLKSYSTFFITGVILGCSFFAFSSDFAFKNLLETHQQERINVWLHPEKCDPRGALYNVLQSKIAIGSGGLTGKGFLNGTLTKLNYVPEQTTDFIFCTIGEEHGFIGSFIVIGLFFVLLLRLTILAERQKLSFGRNYIWGVTGILFFHFMINIGMTMGLVPIIGIPLPLVSYGGSSLLSFTILIGLALKLDSSQSNI